MSSVAVWRGLSTLRTFLVLRHDALRIRAFWCTLLRSTIRQRRCVREGNAARTGLQASRRLEVNIHTHRLRRGRLYTDMRSGCPARAGPRRCSLGADHLSPGRSWAAIMRPANERPGDTRSPHGVLPTLAAQLPRRRPGTAGSPASPTLGVRTLRFEHVLFSATILREHWRLSRCAGPTGASAPCVGLEIFATPTLGPAQRRYP